MAFTHTARAARLSAHGDPAQVLRVEDVTVPEPSPGQVGLRMLLAPINPADLNVIEGTYGKLPPLPATAGNDGVGEVVAVGPGVTALALGDLVRPMDGVGSWCSATVADATRCLRLPTDLPLEQAAQLAVNPVTAWGVLNEFASLRSGDVVLVNAATSGVGRSLIALAQSRGLRVGALVRRPESVAEITALGAEVVVVDDRAASKVLRERLPPAALALNQVGGDSSATLAKCLAPGSWLVTIGAMGRQPLTIGNGPLIFNELKLTGFWVSRWYERAPAEHIATAVGECAALMRSGALHLPVDAVLPLEQVQEAIARAKAGGRGGKVLLDLK